MAKNVKSALLAGFICLITICFPASSEDRAIWVATVQDTINPMVSEYLTGVINDAQAAGAQAVIIELDTPGGLVESTRVIVQGIMNSKIPVVTYVSPKGARAASAGMFITIASHVAVMAPATNIGAAHPVSMGPGGPIEEEKDTQSDNSESPTQQSDTDADQKQVTCDVERVSDTEVMEDKVMNDILAWSRTIAENRGRNTEWVIRAVEDSISSTETEALEAGVIDLIASDLTELLQQLDGREVIVGQETVVLNTQNARVNRVAMTWRQRFLSASINPTLAIYLLVIGGLGLYYELSNPGFIVPGVAGGICMILGLFAMHTLPIRFAGLLLILLAFVFFALEVKVTSYGGLTIGGIIAFVLGSTMLVDSVSAGMKVSMMAVIPLAICAAVVTIVLLALTIRAHKNPVKTGQQGMEGLTGKVTRRLEPVGQVAIRGEIWRAQAVDQSTILENTEVIVVKSEGLTLIVNPVEEKSTEV